DRIGPYEKFNLENGDYLINSGCPTGAPVINLAFIGKKRTTTTTTIPSETGYDVCNNGKGWSEPSSSAQKCGWPSGSKGNMKDCCCCYLTTHVHDLGKVFNEGTSIEIEYKPGWAQGCTSPMFVYYSEDGKEWNLFYNATVTQETWHPKTIYKKTLTVPGDFRYIKIYIPKCYNDYSSAKVIATGGGGGEGAEEEEVSELQCEIKHEVKGEVELSGDAQNTLDELLAKLSSYGGELEIKYKVKKQDGSVSIEKDEISGELNEEEMELWNILKEDVYNLVESTEEDDVELEIEIEVECEEETTEEQPSQSTEVSVQIPETTATTVVQEDVEKTCSGCWYKYKCVQYGVRITENGVPSYCDFDGAFKVQKENGEDCLNNYECKSNFCSDGECYNIKGELKETKGLLESIMSFLRSLFGFGKK
ncbi:MAG: discoidin domain-containing protein, partial [Candidatus Aenigmarchaeota archaeon]|nr:discoidin domain-containing protein [Candidatus Aenigmarchaeota archaeon]